MTRKHWKRSPITCINCRIWTPNRN